MASGINHSQIKKKYFLVKLGNSSERPGDNLGKLEEKPSSTSEVKERSSGQVLRSSGQVLKSGGQVKWSRDQVNLEWCPRAARGD
ncbi:hypothetical protein Tco_0527050 [Tanacetum coccineum]